jgi:hypothetical protein
LGLQNPEVGLDMARGGDGVAVAMGGLDYFGFVVRIEVGQTTAKVRETLPPIEMAER